MKKWAILTLIVVLSTVTQVYAFNRAEQNPYYRTRNYYYNRVLPNDLCALEKYSMRRTFTGERPEKRLERLEKLAFGAPQVGELDSRYKNIETAILSRPGYEDTKTSVVNNLANFINGRATGYTPPINLSGSGNFIPSLPTQADYGNQRFNQFSNGLFGSGYNFLNSSTGSGSSIKILK